jgi:Tfp pilus assembly protein PilO
VRRFGPFIAGGVALLLVLIAVSVLVLPKRNQVGEVEDQIVVAEDEAAALRLQLAQLQEAQEEAPQTRREIRRIEGLVPPTADLPGLIRLLKSSAERSAVDFFTVSPGNPTADPSGRFSTISTGVTLIGTFFSMEEFLYRIETLPRAAKVVTVAIQPRAEGGAADQDGGQLTMTVTVELYTSDSSAGPGSAPGPTEAPAGG